MDLHDLGNRIRAARAYAGDMSREELAALLEQSVGWLRMIEGGRGIKPVEAIGVIQRVSDICNIPAAWFTADWSQLDPGYEPPEDHLQRLEETVDSLNERIERLADAGDSLRDESRKTLEEFLAAQRIDSQERLKPFVKRLDRIEDEQVTSDTFTEAVDLIRQAIDALSERLPRSS